MAKIAAGLRGGRKLPTPDNEATTKGVYITDESLTFPSAAAVCSAILGALNLFVDKASTNPVNAGIICAIVGLFIVVAGWPGPEANPKKVTVYLGVGLLNTALLFTSVIGVTAAATQQVPAL